VSYSAILYLKVLQREEEEEIPVTPSQENTEAPREMIEPVTKMIDEDQ